jgi:hypothetical protein
MSLDLQTKRDENIYCTLQTHWDELTVTIRQTGMSLDLQTNWDEFIYPSDILG